MFTKKRHQVCNIAPWLVVLAVRKNTAINCNRNKGASDEMSFSMSSYGPVRDDSPDCVSESYFCHWKNIVEDTVPHPPPLAPQKGNQRGTSPFATHSQGAFEGTSSHSFLRVLHYTILHSAWATVKNFT